MWPGREVLEVSAIRASRLRVGSRRGRIALLRSCRGRRGSESSTRSGVRRSPRGHVEYRSTCPPSRRTPARVCRRGSSSGTGRSHMPARLTAMGLAAVRPAPLRRALAGVEIVHYPLTIRIPPLDAPSVVTLHDLQHLELPPLFSRGERLFARSPTIARPARRQSSCARARLSPNAPPCCSPSPRPWSASCPTASTTPFHPGSGRARAVPALSSPSWPHKNHPRLFEAFASLRVEHPGLRLVLTGGGAYPPLPDSIEARGLVSKEELVSLYQHPRHSSSRRSTKASGSRRSRRWPAAVRSRPPPPPPSRRSAVRRRACSARRSRGDRRRRPGGAGGARRPGARETCSARAHTPGSAPRGTTRRSTASFADRASCALIAVAVGHREESLPPRLESSACRRCTVTSTARRRRRRTAERRLTFRQLDRVANP